MVGGLCWMVNHKLMNLKVFLLQYPFLIILSRLWHRVDPWWTTGKRYQVCTDGRTIRNRRDGQWHHIDGIGFFDHHACRHQIEPIHRMWWFRLPRQRGHRPWGPLAGHRRIRRHQSVEGMLRLHPFQMQDIHLLANQKRLKFKISKISLIMIRVVHVLSL